MKNYKVRRTGFIFFHLIFLLIIFSQITNAEESPLDIMEKSFRVYQGKDSLSTLTFVIRESGKSDKKIVQKRAFKLYSGKGGLEAKTILANEYPPHIKGAVLMVWVYSPETNKKDDTWMYIPAIRKIIKNVEGDTGGFEPSVLKSYDLVPRYPALDNHKLLRMEKIDNILCFVIETTPRENKKNFPYSKTIKWISKEKFVPLRVDSYDLKGNLEKHIYIKWKTIGNALVWEKVTGTNVKTNNKTTLSITDIKIDVGLEDRIFTKRMLARGSANIFNR